MNRAKAKTALSRTGLSIFWTRQEKPVPTDVVVFMISSLKDCIIRHGATVVRHAVLLTVEKSTRNLTYLRDLMLTFPRLDRL